MRRRDGDYAWQCALPTNRMLAEGAGQKEFLLLRSVYRKCGGRRKLTHDARSQSHGHPRKGASGFQDWSWVLATQMFAVSDRVMS